MKHILPIIANVIGVLAVALFVLSYQQKTRKGIILCNILSRGLYVVQYLLLGAFEGAVLDILGMGVSLLAQKKDAPAIKKYLSAVIISTDLMVVAVGLLLYENVFSLLPICGVLLHTGAFWMMRERRIRAVSFLGSPFWFVYNLVSRAYGSAIGDAMTMFSIAIAIIRYDVLKREQKQS